MYEKSRTNIGIQLNISISALGLFIKCIIFIWYIKCYNVFLNTHRRIELFILCVVHLTMYDLILYSEILVDDSILLKFTVSIHEESNYSYLICNLIEKIELV